MCLRSLLESKTDRAFSIFDGDDYVGQCKAHGPRAVEALTSKVCCANDRFYDMVRRSILNPD